MVERTSTQILPHTSCSLLSLGRDEPLIGSAPRVEIWFLLSYRGPIGAKAFEEANIPSSVKDFLSRQLESIPHSRLLLTKPHQQQAAGLTFQIVIGRELDPFYFSFELSSYEDVLALDTAKIFDEDPKHADKISRKPFYAVCTNGNRDPCCAKYGLRAYIALSTLASEQVWQCSHVGGHRFAANVIEFPHAIYYGRVEPADSQALLQAGDQGEIKLGNYRGRACHEPVVQAAEALLRQQTGDRNLSAFRMVDCAEIEPETWLVQFLKTDDERIHQIVLNSKVSEEKDIVSCRSDKQSPVIRYELIAYDLENQA